jgi:hypothetical protein
LPLGLPTGASSATSPDTPLWSERGYPNRTPTNSAQTFPGENDSLHSSVAASALGRAGGSTPTKSCCRAFPHGRRGVVAVVPASFSYGRGRWDKTDDAWLVLGAAITTEKPLLHRPLPKPPCLALADPQDGGDLSHRLAIPEQGGRLTKEWRGKPTRLTPNRTYMRFALGAFDQPEDRRRPAARY